MINTQKIESKLIACASCGCTSFERSAQEDGCIVELHKEKFGFTDVVIEEGEMEYQYACTECGEGFTAEGDNEEEE